jgi:hypothetical protein
MWSNRNYPLRVEVGGLVEMCSHSLDVLALTGVEQLVFLEYRDALHQVVALGLGLADLMVIPEASSA